MVRCRSIRDPHEYCEINQRESGSVEKTDAGSRQENASRRRMLGQLTELVRPDWGPRRCELRILMLVAEGPFTWDRHGDSATASPPVFPPGQCHVTFAEFAEEFKRILRAHGGAGGRTTAPKHKGTRQNVR